MSRTKSWITALATAVWVTPSAFAFDSGSTGADGPLSPTVNTELQLPASGVFNFTTVNVPSGVTVRFRRNTLNTPVVILATGNVTIAGALDLNGGASTHSGAARNGNVGDDGIPGVGAAGGYDGGAGGPVPRGAGGAGQGPGGGSGGFHHSYRTAAISFISGGGGGGFAEDGRTSWSTGDTNWIPTGGGMGGPTYGSTVLLPLIGGSGGGGAGAGTEFRGSGGGGGGGALLIAATGTVNITGAIVANGGISGESAGANCGQTGGGGSGGGLRIVATTLSGNGTLSANGGAAVGASCGGTHGGTNGGAGAPGRIRLEAENITRTAASSPAHTFGVPGPVFIAGLPTLRITSVAGVAAPAEPTGTADITLPATTTNPVTVSFATTSVPVGNTVRLSIKPANGATISALSPALTGTTENATASVDVDLPTGPSTLEATTTYTIVAALGDDLGLRYAQGERVLSIELTAGLKGDSTVTLITVSGKRYTVPSHEVAAMVVG